MDPQKLQQQYQQQQQQAEKLQQQEQMKDEMLSQILTPAAKDRLGNIKMAKPEKANQITMKLLQVAQSGQLKEKISEQQLIELLDDIAEKEKKTTSVKFQRRGLDDDDW
ncbi:PDCD5-related protein [Pseudocohnilembus persalinus]|uniref:PDCD5-related protein n=1 Tax=Pseudocohnilembus persalinus TaxID=266149 RepID=A0A0V0Q8U8_PSEPJ|nr:PDCD5-related protein [Pseudocohnilembus persalinus]|eukprot:KRW98674.1 PDCD5-related protein [Pseudocohnilembus persalinus]